MSTRFARYEGQMIELHIHEFELIELSRVGPNLQTNPKLREGSATCCHNERAGKLSSLRQQTVESFPLAELAVSLQKAGTREAPGVIPAGRHWRRGTTRTSNRGRGL